MPTRIMILGKELTFDPASGVFQGDPGIAKLVKDYLDIERISTMSGIQGDGGDPNSPATFAALAADFFNGEVIEVEPAEEIDDDVFY